MDVNECDFITEELMEEIVVFESFLDRIGFKRIDGSVFGLLVLSSRPLSSEEIERTLGLSQSAVSLSLKNLAHFGAIETRDARQKRLKLHSAKENSLSIVASVFRKREQESVLEFKEMAQRSLKKMAKDPENSLRITRLQSILATCQLAEEVIAFVMNLAKIENQEVYRQIINRVPKTLNMMMKTAIPLGNATEKVAEKLTDKFKETLFENLQRFTSDGR